ncbi:MAG: hypothetical protein JRM80_04990 [Nitrososphaerota archaeon]|nr:hypothetical protein [Nitrososphaerota archaeon]
MATNTAVLVVGSMIAVFIIGLGMGWAFQTTVSPGSASTSNAQTQSSVVSRGPFLLTLVEIMQNTWNSSAGMQPKFFLLGGDGLESSANISLPADRPIQLTIISYDTPTPDSTNAEGIVSGTVGGTVYVINGSVAAGTVNVSMAMAADWGQNVTAAPASQLAHTFTIQQLGINIPVVADSTVIADLEIHQTGTFTWLCMTPCGLGNDGNLGAMATPGWMMGSVVASGT